MITDVKKNLSGRLWLLALSLLWGTRLCAQELPPTVGESSFVLGIGRSNQLDTYLSPIEFTGKQVTLMQE